MPKTGPHLAIAVICERVLQESDGVLSIIRVVDRVTQTAAGPDPPPMTTQFNAALQREGLYWFDVLLGGLEQEDELLTRLPLEVHYQRQVTRA